MAEDVGDGNDKKFCFFISVIGDPGTPERMRSDGILDEIIRPALEEKYCVERADHDKTPGIVTDGIIGKLLDAELVIADLTGNNANVFYELAVRHATSKPIIQMLEFGHKLPFDIQAVNTIFFHATLHGRSKAIRELQAAVTAVEANPETGNPIKRAGQFRALLTSAAPDIQVLAEAVRDLQISIAQGSQHSATIEVDTELLRSGDPDLGLLEKIEAVEDQLRASGINNVKIRQAANRILVYLSDKKDFLFPIPLRRFRREKVQRIADQITIQISSGTTLSSFALGLVDGAWAGEQAKKDPLE